jgi:hypothetical protein
MCFHNHIYAVPEKCACFLLTLNVILPGTGTMLQSCLGKDGCRVGTFFVGLLQMMCTALIFGWFWAVWHSMMVKAVSAPNFDGLPAPESELPGLDNQEKPEGATAGNP